MANQYIHTEYTEVEVQKILDLYALGQSKTQIAHIFHRKKDNIQKILISNGVWDENRGDWKKVFTESEIVRIKNMYVVDGFGTAKIGLEFGVSNQPIKSVLRKLGLLRSGMSNGVKIILTSEQQETIKRLYTIEYKNIKEIALAVGLTDSFVNKYLSSAGYRRSVSESVILTNTGRKISDKGRKNMSEAQRKVYSNTNRLVTGGVCKTFMVYGLKCQGTYEKAYIEFLKSNNQPLPENGVGIITPYGKYYPDFKNSDGLIDVKSPYTYDVLMGIKTSRWTRQYETKQLNKIQWVAKNVSPVSIVIIDGGVIKDIKNFEK